MGSKQELVGLTQRLLDAIAACDWDTYTQLCDPDLTAFEPEARGQRVEGMAFHKYYFDLGAATGAVNTTMIDPRVRSIGDDGAVVTYVRLVQRQTPDGPATACFEETRVWERQAGSWRHIHFHRSAPA